MKKVFLGGLVLCFACCLVLPLSLQAKTKNVPALSVVIQGEMLEFPDQTPVIQQERVLVPIRPVLESGYVQAKVLWDKAQQKVLIYDQRSVCVQLEVGKNQGKVTDTQGLIRDLPLDAAPIIIQGRVMLPLRALMEIFEYYVVWRPSLRCVEIQDSLPAWRHLLPLDQWQAKLKLWQMQASEKGACLPCLLKD